MTDNAMAYLFTKLSDCCAEHYNYNYHSCVGAGTTPNAHLYFPDWGGDDEKCQTGGGQPEYMNYSPSTWMHATLAECCSVYYR